jgi:hypothetical protein
MTFTVVEATVTLILAALGAASLIVCLLVTAAMAYSVHGDLQRDALDVELHELSRDIDLAHRNARQPLETATGQSPPKEAPSMNQPDPSPGNVLELGERLVRVREAERDPFRIRRGRYGVEIPTALALMARTVLDDTRSVEHRLDAAMVLAEAVERESERR